MPSTLAHYAVGAAVLAILGLRGRRLALVSLWAAVPDLDILTAAPWALIAPHLDVGADALIQGAYLVGHRGLSHTFLAAVLVGAGVAAVRRSRWAGLYAAVAWAAHVLLDIVSPWPATPFWPFSTAKVHAPTVTGLDPILTLFSIGAVVALLGPWVARRVDRLGPRIQRRADRFRDGWARRLAFASLAAVLLNVAWLGAVATVNGDPYGSVYSANVPRTVTIRPDPGGYEVHTSWSPWDDGAVSHLPAVADRSIDPNATRALTTAQCTIEGLGPYSPIDDPIWVARPGERGLLVEAIDLVRNATQTGSPRLMFTFVEGELDRVAVTGENGEDDWLQIRVPWPVVEAARCP